MQHNLAGAVAARLGVNSSHVMLRSINPARTPARRLRALSAQVCMYSLINFAPYSCLGSLRHVSAYMHLVAHCLYRAQTVVNLCKGALIDICCPRCVLQKSYCRKIM